MLLTNPAFCYRKNALRWLNLKQYRDASWRRLECRVMRLDFTMQESRKFPVLNPPKGCASWVRWDALDAEWAKRLHGQTLERLAERGGLCPEEIVLNQKRLPWNTKVDRQQAIEITNGIAA